jgi:signal transduction histidine kinase
MAPLSAGGLALPARSSCAKLHIICSFVTTGKLSAVASALRLANVHPSFEGMSLFNSVLARQTVGYLLAGSLALLAIVFAALWLAARAHDHADEVSHDREVRNAYSVILSDLMDAETGQRGYLLTRSDRYLQPYETARQKLTADLAHLRNMLTADTSMAPRLARLDSLANAKLAELAQTIRLENAGQHDDALALVNSDRGLKLMGAARDLLGELIAAADGRVAYRLAELDRAVSYLISAIASGSVLIVLFTAAAAYTIMRYTRDLLAAQQEVTALNAGLEERVQERTSALQRANDEIQRFAYIVSHDLRSPLVNVMGFTSELEASIETLQNYVFADQPGQKLREDAQVAVKEDVPEALRFIRASTGKMDGLINAILKLSREGRRELNPELVDLDQLFAQAAASLQHQLDEVGAVIALPATSPRLLIDRLVIEQVVGNLLDNAVKYLAPGRPGRISIDAEQVAGRVYISITDNGRGIAPQDHERIFELFRRSGAQDRPGEGIGLAHVRALVRRLGGDITVSSELGRGSVFRIDLPARLEPNQTG